VIRNLNRKLELVNGVQLFGLRFNSFASQAALPASSLSHVTIPPLAVSEWNSTGRMASRILETIQQRVRHGNYLVKSHAVIHALKEGFDRANMVEAVLNGSIIEDYREARRVLVVERRW